MLERQVQHRVIVGPTRAPRAFDAAGSHRHAQERRGRPVPSAGPQRGPGSVGTRRDRSAPRRRPRGPGSRRQSRIPDIAGRGMCRATSGGRSLRLRRQAPRARLRTRSTWPARGSGSAVLRGRWGLPQRGGSGPATSRRRQRDALRGFGRPVHLPRKRHMAAEGRVSGGSTCSNPFARRVSAVGLADRRSAPPRARRPPFGPAPRTPAGRPP